jgi:nitrilase
MPTNQERLFHGQGAGGDLKVVETEIGRIGGLICWENQMPLARYAIEKQAPDIWLAPTADFEDGWQAFARAISIESGAFVVTSPVFMRPSDFPKDFPIPAPDDFSYDGGSAIVAPGGAVIAGPLRGEEGLVVADCDLSQVLRHRRGFDVSGHYAREEVLLPEISSWPVSPA